MSSAERIDCKRRATVPVNSGAQESTPTGNRDGYTTYDNTPPTGVVITATLRTATSPPV